MSLNIPNINAWVWRAELVGETLGLPQGADSTIEYTRGDKITAFALARMFRDTNISPICVGVEPSNGGRPAAGVVRLGNIMKDQYGFVADREQVVLEDETGLLDHISERGLHFVRPGDLMHMHRECSNSEQAVEVLRFLFQVTRNKRIYNLSNPVLKESDPDLIDFKI